MKHRLLLLLLFVFTASVAGWAQKSVAPSYTIKGVLLDSLTQEGEPYATIRITKKNAPEKALKMAVTGANGKFQEKLNVPAGDYVISISSIGKAPVVKEFTLKSSTAGGSLVYATGNLFISIQSQITSSLIPYLNAAFSMLIHFGIMLFFNVFHNKK